MGKLLGLIYFKYNALELLKIADVANPSSYNSIVLS